jgi:lipoprotein-anchoring transpeptidase ErfK/SrfK
MKRLLLLLTVVAGIALVPTVAAAQDERAGFQRPATQHAANDRMPFPALMNTLFARPRATEAPAPRFHRPGSAGGPTPRVVRQPPQTRHEPAISAPRARTAPEAAPVPRARTARQMDPRYERQVVTYTGGEAPGTVVVDVSERFLYFVQDDGTALRYGVGVGREGFSWKGSERVTRKAEWPSWRPPEAMKRRQPGLPDYMPGGPDNPLGARALYLGSTLYRIHGSNEPWTIGQAVSSGCIRMRNEDVIDLYERVAVGAKVIVR